MNVGFGSMGFGTGERACGAEFTHQHFWLQAVWNKGDGRLRGQCQNRTAQEKISGTGLTFVVAPSLQE